MLNGHTTHILGQLSNATLVLLPTVPGVRHGKRKTEIHAPMRLLVLVITATLASCTTVSEIRLPDGSYGHSINCSGTAQSWGNCYTKAEEICGESGYDVVAGGAKQGSTPATQYGAYRSSNMLIKCR